VLIDRLFCRNLKWIKIKFGALRKLKVKSYSKFGLSPNSFGLSKNRIERRAKEI